MLYKNYISFLTNGTFDHNTNWANKNNKSDIFLPNYNEYWSGLGNYMDPITKTMIITENNTAGYSIIIDLRASAGFSNKIEPVVQADVIVAEISFSKALPEAMSLVVCMAYRTQYAISKSEKGSGSYVSYATNSNINIA